MQNAIVPDGYGIKYHAYHTITEGVFLPSGTSLPGGAVLPMSSVADFPMVLPQGKRTRGDGTLIGFQGSKLPGGVMVPVSRQHWHLVSNQQAYLTAWPDRDAEEDQSGDHQDCPRTSVRSPVMTYEDEDGDVASVVGLMWMLLIHVWAVNARC